MPGDVSRFQIRLARSSSLPARPGPSPESPATVKGSAEVVPASLPTRSYRGRSVGGTAVRERGALFELFLCVLVVASSTVSSASEKSRDIPGDGWRSWPCHLASLIIASLLKDDVGVVLIALTRHSLSDYSGVCYLTGG
jgi:hypothetical protein